MKKDMTNGWTTRAKAWSLASWLCLAAAAPAGWAVTIPAFAPVQHQLTTDAATLSALTNRTPAQRALLKKVTKACGVATNLALADGKALGQLNSQLRQEAGYETPLNAVATNLVSIFNNEYNFVGQLLEELPPSAAAEQAADLFGGLTPITARLNAKVSAGRTSGLYDAAKRRLDVVFNAASAALFVPFPDDLSSNSVAARINNISMRSGVGVASENVFSAVNDGTRIVLTVNAIDFPRGLLFSVPNVKFGTYRYRLSGDASFTNRTGIYLPSENSVAASSGSIFISTSDTEVYGIFSCSGPGFTVTNGRFRVSVTPAISEP